MALKLLVVLYLVQVVIINVIDAQFHGYVPEVEKLVRNLSRPGFAESEECGKTVCNAPCPGAYPPLRCPPDIPPCHFGCACHIDCEKGMVTCFQIQHCVQIGRFFTARRRAKMS